MSDLEARIAEVVGRHIATEARGTTTERGGGAFRRCSCGYEARLFYSEMPDDVYDSDGPLETVLAAHVAAMLAPMIREREAEAWAEGRSACDREWSEITSGVSAHDMGSAHETPNPYRSNDEHEPV